MKILNGYGGLGGNRRLWGNAHTITMVDADPVICDMYADLYPNDTVVQDDVNAFLRHAAGEFDLCWLSPPCQPNTRLVIANWGRYRKIPPIPNFDMLYAIQPWLRKCYSGLWVIENVVPWYPPPYRPTAKLGRHLFWSNFPIPARVFTYDRPPIDKIPLKELAAYEHVDLTWLRSYAFPHWTKNHDVYRTLLRNMVDPRIGRYILDCATRATTPLQASMDAFL